MRSITTSSSSTIITSASPAMATARFWVWERAIFGSTGWFMFIPFLSRRVSRGGRFVLRCDHAPGERARLGEKARRLVQVAALRRLLELQRRRDKRVVSHAARRAFEPVRERGDRRRVARANCRLALREGLGQPGDELAPRGLEALLARETRPDRAAQHGKSRLRHCSLSGSRQRRLALEPLAAEEPRHGAHQRVDVERLAHVDVAARLQRSEERRVGKECRSWWAP